MVRTRADLVLVDAVLSLPGREALEGWISVVDGRIDQIGTGHPPPADVERVCDGRWVLPGLVDIHVHFRDPGFTHKEDFVSGSAAAAAGGVTTVIDMPNTGNLVVSPDDLREKLAIATGRSHVDFGLYALLVDSAPYITELAELGVAGLKWLMGYERLHGHRSQPSSRTKLRETLERAAEGGLLVGVHAEDASWIRELEGYLRAKGRHDPAAHGDSRPPYVEALAIAEAVILAAECGTRIHIHHLSTELGLRILRSIQDALGCNISAETCPHHLMLTAEALDALGTRARVNPPLRSQEDVRALWEGVIGGGIDCIASDHAPHAPNEKRTDSVWDAQSGLIGVETTFPLLFNQVRQGNLPLHRFVEATAQRPAEIVGLGHRKGKLQPGHDGDLIIIDPNASTVIAADALHSKHPETVFDGLECKGALESVYLRGKLIADHGKVVEGRRGTYVPSQTVPAPSEPC